MAQRRKPTFIKPSNIAHRQQSKSLGAAGRHESGRRLWQLQGKRDEARELLTPIYSWFTERFPTAYLQEAKALLEKSRRGASVLPLTNTPVLRSRLPRLGPSAPPEAPG